MRTISIAKTLVKERHKKGISQEELAGYMGVSKAAVSKWENEQSFPDIMLLPEQATFFNISLDELMGYQPQEALGLVNEQVRPLSQETELLAQIYQRLGNVEKAKEVTQIAMYQHLLLLIGDGTYELLLYIDEYGKAEEIMNRIDSVAEIFQVNSHHPNVMASMCENPGLLMLKDNPKFQKLEKQLKQSLDIEGEKEEC